MSAPASKPPLRVAMTLDIHADLTQEYIDHHAHSWPEIESALRSVGLRNISLWVWESRMFYYAEYVGEEEFDAAMERYSKMPRVKEWEELMHKYQKKLPGMDEKEGDVWWMPMTPVYHQD
mmetsp:Transcript_14314/g.38321  ORF Transcript_14314/g.38321 Transcript_14314/m.38321 type:complete len:120 (+) Transcript_14314:106-465(+)